MADLYPTPTRLALLRDVAAGYVLEGNLTDDEQYQGDVILLPELDTEPIRRVTASIEEMKSVGWVELGGGATWRLTDAGRAVLERAR